jgi:hypothetical protein
MQHLWGVNRTFPRIVYQYYRKMAVVPVEIPLRQIARRREPARQREPHFLPAPKIKALWPERLPGMRHMGSPIRSVALGQPPLESVSQNRVWYQ